MTILGWGFDLKILAVARKLGYEVDVLEAPDWKDPKVAARPDFDYVEASFTTTATCSLLHVYATY